MRDVERRIRELELTQRVELRRAALTTPIYTVIREGEPRPNIDGPVYRLVSAR